MEKKASKLTTATPATAAVDCITATTTEAIRPRFDEAGLNVELGCSAFEHIYEDHRHRQNHEPERTQFLQLGFPPDYLDSWMFPVNPLGIEQSGFDNVGGSVGSFQGKQSMADTGGGTSYPLDPFRPSSKTQHQQLIRWPSAITKAARSKRRMARRMGSSGSFSSSSLSFSLSPLAPISEEHSFPATATPRDLNNNEDESSGEEETRTIKTSDNKTLRFLFQKELKNSDVSSLGRIVFPKKDAEAHLPSLTVKEGIQIGVRDVKSTTVWCMRYRFWPNNCSRMYVLENTGDFVKQNGLQAGDSIMMYEDENKKLFIHGKKSECNPRRSGFLMSPQLYHAPLQQQHQQPQLQFCYVPQIESNGVGVSGENRVEIAEAQQSDMPPKKQDRQGSSSILGESWSLAAGADADADADADAGSFSSSSSSNGQPPPPVAWVWMEEPSLWTEDATVREGYKQVTGACGCSAVTNFDDSVFGELEMLPNVGSLYDYLMKGDDDDDNNDMDTAENGDTAPMK